MEADRRDVVILVRHGAMVQRLDIGKRVGEFVPRYAHLVRCKPVKHEGVIGVGAVGNLNLANFCCCSSHVFLWCFAC